MLTNYDGDGDQYKRMLTLGNTFKIKYNEIMQRDEWIHVGSCYASDHWDCKYKKDCNGTKRFRCNPNHHIAIKFDQFDGLYFLAHLKMGHFINFLTDFYSSVQKRLKGGIRML